jgi:hypothetical protein
MGGIIGSQRGNLGIADRQMKIAEHTLQINKEVKALMEKQVAASIELTDKIRNESGV